MNEHHSCRYVYIEPLRAQFPLLIVSGVVVVFASLVAEYLNGLSPQIAGPILYPIEYALNAAFFPEAQTPLRPNALRSWCSFPQWRSLQPCSLPHGRCCEPRHDLWASLMHGLFLLGVAAGLLLRTTASGSESFTPDPERWRPVAYSDLRLPRGEAESYASIWQDRLDQSNSKPAPDSLSGRPVADPSLGYAVGNRGASEWHFTINFQTKLAALTVLDAPGVCTDEFASPAAGVKIKVCPMRLAMFEADRYAL